MRRFAFAIPAFLFLSVSLPAFAQPAAFKEVKLDPSDTVLGDKIKLAVQRYSPPIWFRGTNIVQGSEDLPWIPAARAGVVQPSLPYQDLKPFATESFFSEDLSQAAYEKSQQALLGRPSTSERCVFYTVDVQTRSARFLIQVGWSLQLLNEPSTEYPPTARLYEMQDGKWLMTSTKANREVLSLPWQTLVEIDAMIRNGAAVRNEIGQWRAVSR